jgi:hypothetical protein
MLFGSDGVSKCFYLSRNTGEIPEKDVPVRSHYFFNATDASVLQQLLYRQSSDFFPVGSERFNRNINTKYQAQRRSAQQRPTQPLKLCLNVSSKATSVPDQISSTGRYAIVFRYIQIH